MPPSTTWLCGGAALHARGPAPSNRCLHEQQEPPPSAPGTGSMPPSTAWPCGVAALRVRDRPRRTAASTSSQEPAPSAPGPALRGCAWIGAAPPGPAPRPGPRGGTGSSSASKKMRAAAFKAARGREDRPGPGRAASALAGRRAVEVPGPRRFRARSTDPEREPAIRTDAARPRWCGRAWPWSARARRHGPHFGPCAGACGRVMLSHRSGGPRPGARGGSAQDVPAAGAQASVAPGETAFHQRRWRRRAGPDGGSACMGCADAWRVIRLCVFRRSLEVERATDLTCSGR